MIVAVWRTQAPTSSGFPAGAAALGRHKWGGGCHKSGPFFAESRCISLRCDGDHSRTALGRILTKRGAASALEGTEGAIARGRSFTLDQDPRHRASGLGAKRGPRADLPQRGAKSAAPALFPRARASRSLVSVLSMNAELHVRASMDALGALRVVEAGARRLLPAVGARAPRSATVSVPNPMRRGAGRLRAAVKLTNTISLGPLPSETDRKSVM